MLSISFATSSAGSATGSTLAIRRSRSRAVTPAERSTTPPASTTTLTNGCWSSAQQSVLALKDPPGHSDSRRVSGVHPAIAEAARTQGASLGVRRVRGVVDDAEVEGEPRHVDAFAERIPVRLSDLVAGVEIRAGLHLHDRVTPVVIEVEIVAVL